MTYELMAWLFAIPLLGAMTGLRTLTPITILCWFAYLGHLDVQGTWAFWTSKLAAAVIFSILAVGELIGDKLPKTPDRISLFPLLARILFGGLVGALAATGLHGSTVEGILLGALGSVAGALIGFNLRSWLVKDRGLPDILVALVEDAFAIGLSLLALGIVTG